MPEPLQLIRSTAIPLPIENIDTDQIIPARFLKSTSRTGFGKHLFQDWRYSDDNMDLPRHDFVFNDARYAGRILIAGRNFGCGSSREHAAWAIKDSGIDVVISSFFADIFMNNALNNFLLPLTVSDTMLHHLLDLVTMHPETELVVDIALQQLLIPAIRQQIAFDINTYKKTCLLNGFDDLDYLLSMKEQISAFESSQQFG